MWIGALGVKALALGTDGARSCHPAMTREAQNTISALLKSMDFDLNSLLSIFLTSSIPLLQEDSLFRIY
jgi:hypothetical protein